MYSTVLVVSKDRHGTCCGRDAVLLIEEVWSKKVDIRRAAAGDELDVCLINQEYSTVVKFPLVCCHSLCTAV